MPPEDENKTAGGTRPEDQASPKALPLRGGRQRVGGAELTEKLLPSFKAGRQPGRVVVVEQVYHQLPGKDPTAYPTRTSTVCQSNERPYQRPMVLGPQWQRIDLGWFQKTELAGVGPGLVLIQNATPSPVPVMHGGRPPKGGGLNGTRGYIQVSVNGEEPQFVLPPGESLRFRPTEAANIWLRAVGLDATEASVTVFPK